MRTLHSFNTPTPATMTTTTTPIKASFSPAAAVMATPSHQQQRSPWHSPVPYLFGGLAAMLGLIAFALLILACSYWKLSSRLENTERDDVESGGGASGDGKDQAGESGKSVKVFEEKFLVIMAGDDKPTFLATPVCSKASSFVNTVQSKEDVVDDDDDNTRIENVEKIKEVHDYHLEETASTSSESQENHHNNQEQTH